MLPCLCQICFRVNEGWIFQVLEETSESHLCLKKENVNFITSLILAWLKFDDSNILLVWMVYDPLCLFSVDFNCNKSKGCSCACPIRQWGFSTWLSWKTWKLTQAAHHWLAQFDWTCPRSFSMLTVSTMIFINDTLCLDLTLWRSKTYEVPWYEHVSGFVLDICYLMDLPLSFRKYISLTLFRCTLLEFDDICIFSKILYHRLPVIWYNRLHIYI